MGGVRFGHAAVFHRDLDERAVHVFGHAGLVATDVEVRAVVEPFPNFCAVLFEPVLNVDLLFLVTGPSRREPVEVAAVHPAFDLFLVVVLGVLRLVAEE